MKHLDLFSGIGGFALACDWAGIETIGFVEIDKYCQKVLRKHWPGIPIVEDIRDVEAIKEIVADTAGTGLPDRRRASMAVSGGAQPESERCGSESDRLQEPSGQYGDNGTSPEPAILITAGFPCQPFSVAGKRGGDMDDRYLWPQTLAVIEAVKPAWVLLENVAGIIPMALDTVLSDLEGAGYSWETVVIPACAVNAPHRRDRIWIVGHAAGQRLLPRTGGREGQHPRHRQGVSTGGSEDATNPSCKGLEGRESKPELQRAEQSSRCSQEDATDTQRAILEGADTEGDSRRGRQPGEHEQWQRQADWWAVEPGVGRVAHGIPSRVDRLKSLGNAIVPQVAYEVIRVIKDLER